MLLRGRDAISFRPTEASLHLTPCAPRDAETEPAISSQTLVSILVRAGAKVVARQEHALFLQTRHRLIFLRHCAEVDSRDLADALRAADIGPGRFDKLLAEVSAETRY
jgi:hypothetical protein